MANVAWEKDGTVVITVAGELDVTTAPGLQRRVDEAASRSAGDVRLDLQRLQFCDAAGLSVLVATERRLRERGRAMRIEQPSAQLLRVLRITDLEHLVGS
jgi:anti-sigma B factor antagonist